MGWDLRCSLPFLNRGVGNLQFSKSAHFKKEETTKSSDSLSSVDKLQADFKTHVICSDFSFDN